MADAVEFKVDPGSFRTLLGKSSEVEPKLRSALRKRVRMAGEEIADEARSRLGSGKLRDQIRAGIRTQLSTTGNGAGIRVTSRGPLAAAWQAEKGWRHPVFARKTLLRRSGQRWVNQKGSPGYFWGAVHDKSPEVRKQIEAAMREAVEGL